MGAVDPTNPQTWNRYAYVANNPLSFTDPTGLLLKGPGNTCVGDTNGIVCGDSGADSGGGEIGGGGMGGFCDASGNCAGIPVCSDEGGCTNVGGIEPPITLPGGITFGVAPLLQAEARYLTIISSGYDPATGDDPCVFTGKGSNGGFNGTVNVVAGVSQQGCQEAGGQWVQPGSNFWITLQGTVVPIYPSFGERFCTGVQAAGAFLTGLGGGLGGASAGGPVVQSLFTAGEAVEAVGAPELFWTGVAITVAAGGC